MPEIKEAPAPQPQKKRAPPRRAQVARVEQVLPRLTRVTFGGDELAGFGPAKPGGHIKLLFPEPGVDWQPVGRGETSNAPRPPSRTYTPRRFDAAQGTLEVEFVLHGDGIATNWLEQAKPGDPLFIGGPGGGYDIPEDAEALVLLADDTALPATGMMLEALPDGCLPYVFCEVTDTDDNRPLSPDVPSTPNWLYRAENNARPGSLLEEAAKALETPPGNCYWWIACEAATMRRIRQHLLKERGIELSHIHSRGYWKLGEENYPDHDYGND